RVLTLTAGDRRAVALQGGRIELRAVREQPLSVDQAAGPALVARADGGLDVTLTGRTDPALSVLGSDGTVAVPGLLTAASVSAAAQDVSGDASVGGSLDVTGGATLGRLSVAATSGQLTAAPGPEGSALDVPSRMRVRQGADGSAGIWLHQNAPDADRA